MRRLCSERQRQRQGLLVAPVLIPRLVKGSGTTFIFLKNIFPCCLRHTQEQSGLILRLIQMKQMHFKSAASHSITTGSLEHHTMYLEGSVFA